MIEGICLRLRAVDATMCTDYSGTAFMASPVPNMGTLSSQYRLKVSAERETVPILLYCEYSREWTMQY